MHKQAFDRVLINVFVVVLLPVVAFVPKLSPVVFHVVAPTNLSESL